MGQADHPTPLRVRVDVPGTSPTEATHRVARRLRIGRDVSCDVRVVHQMVSRSHVELAFEDGAWVVRDAGSTNGTWIDGERITSPVRIEGPTRLQLGRDGPLVEVMPQIERPAPVRATPARSRDARTVTHTQRDASLDDYIKHYVKETKGGGDHTIMIRRAVATVQRTQKRRYAVAIGAIALLAVLAALFAWQKHREVTQLRRSADGIFTQMKELDLQLAQIRTIVESVGDARIGEQLARLESSRARLVKVYEEHLDDLRVYDSVSPEDQVIYRVARAFNESEVTMPPEFLWEVKETIRTYWQSPAGRERFLHAIERAARNGHTGTIAKALRAHGLTPRFFYLALQESNFNTAAVGPPTRYGRAKGMWQFIPATAARFDLYPGAAPDADGVEAGDERCDFAKSTSAAARYLQTIYSTLAQASGLLVVASYNWGEGRVVTKLSDLANPKPGEPDPLADLPEDPAARSYWRFLREFRDRIPAETRDYVLKIFSAAVIGEDPARFGFSIENPLAAFMTASEPPRP